MNIYLVRHGESEANLLNLVCGRKDFPLTEKGHLQAQNISTFFDNLEIGVEVIYTSSLSRAIDTMKSAIPSFKKFIPLENLDEINTGDLSDWNWRKLESEKPELFNFMLNPEVVFPGGESFLEFTNRVNKEFNEIINGHNRDTIAIFAHNGSINAILHELLKKEWDLFPAFNIANCGIAHIRLSKNKNAELINIY